MKKITLKHVFALSTCLFLMSSISFAQEMLKEISLNELVSTSTQIIEGKVISKNSYWDTNNQNIYTVNTVEVYKIFKGQSTLETVEVITSGGVVGLNAEKVSPSLDLVKNEIGVFLLQNNTIALSELSSVPRFRSNASVQGFFKYNTLNNTAVNPFHIKTGITTTFYDELMDLTHSDIIDINSINIDDSISRFNSQRGGTSISSFSPTNATAGTETQLTINGAGFGSQQNVGFSNGNDGGATFTFALQTQIISWSDTQIVVDIPSRAGTGPIAIINSAGDTILATSGASDLNISYAQLNVNSDALDGVNLAAYVNQHVDDNGSDGYTWQMFTDFANNTSANDAFMRAFDTWVCETGINWIIGANTTTDAAVGDGINIIRFDNGSELPNGVLGRCTTRSSGCFINGGTDLAWYVSELDIQFNDTTNWNYSGAPGFTEYDFESVAVHELGHGHQLAHVIDTNAIMHYSISNGEQNITLGVNDIAGAGDVQSRSVSNVVCGNGLMTNSTCSTLSIGESELAENISIYPIPSQSSLFINTPSNILLEEAVIYNVQGQLITKIKLNQTSNKKEIDIRQFAAGVYFINISTENASITKKFMVE